MAVKYGGKFHEIEVTAHIHTPAKHCARIGSMLGEMAKVEMLSRKGGLHDTVRRARLTCIEGLQKDGYSVFVNQGGDSYRVNLTGKAPSTAFIKLEGV